MIYFHIFFTDFNLNLQSTTYNRTPFTKCLLIFLPRTQKIYNFLGKLIRKKIQKSLIVNNDNNNSCMVSPRGSRRAHISSEEDWNFAGKDFCITKIGLEEISSRLKA